MMPFCFNFFEQMEPVGSVPQEKPHARLSQTPPHARTAHLWQQLPEHNTPDSKQLAETQLLRSLKDYTAFITSTSSSW
jgi:hypothetical protein